LNTRSKPSIAKGQELFTHVMQSIACLVDTFYVRNRHFVENQVVCAHCLNAHALTQTSDLGLIPLLDIIKEFRAGKTSIHCPKEPNVLVALADMAPDIVASQLRRIPVVEHQRPFAKGGHDIVDAAILDGQRVAVKICFVSGDNEFPKVRTPAPKGFDFELSHLTLLAS